MIPIPGSHPTKKQGKLMVLGLNFSVVNASVGGDKELEANFNEVITPVIMDFVRTKYKEYFAGFKYSDNITADGFLKTFFKNIKEGGNREAIDSQPLNISF